MSKTITDQIVKGIAKTLVKAIPKIADKLFEKHYDVKDLTMKELVNVFLTNPNSPQCFKLRTPVPVEQAFDVCRSFFKEIKADIEIDLVITKDGWPVISALKKQTPSFWGGIDKEAHVFLVAAKQCGEQTTVIICCRFTKNYGKFDVFKFFQRASLERVQRVANAIAPNAPLEKLSKM